MMDAGEDLMILYRAVRRGAGRDGCAGSVTAPEAWRLVELGLARLIDVRIETGPGHAAPEAAAIAGAASLALPADRPGAPGDEFVRALREAAGPGEILLFMSDPPVAARQAARLAALAGFRGALHVIDSRERYRAPS